MSIGTVYLRVADLDRLVRFYQDAIGLKLHREEAGRAYLGVGGDDLLVLQEDTDGKRYQGVAGLYHFALLVPSRPDLAQVLQHFADNQTQLQGMSDHIVSEAIYLADPEGNGIEIYRDRPRDAWYKNGQFQLGTIALDVRDLMKELPSDEWSGLPAGTTMGHIHLHVDSVPKAETFYTNVLGMDVMANIGSATFLAYDGYHHHVGANIWAGRQVAPDDALGLDHYEIHYNDAAKLEHVLASLEAHDIPVITHNGHTITHDSAHNQVVLVEKGDSV